MKPLILASASPYRRQLLDRLGLPYSRVSPDIDESRRRGESGRHLAARLAREKAEYVAAEHGDSCVIGSDQVATLGDEILGKPGDHQRARSQLQACSGRRVCFETAVYLIGGQDNFAHIDQTEVCFRQLDIPAIDAYLAKEKPFDCAGSFKAEGLGIALFTQIRSDDPTALLGMSMIWLSQRLIRLGYPVL